MAVEFVTFPRSGHHLLVSLLTEVVPDIGYCERYHCSGRCRGDGGGGMVPCIDESKNIVKNHDYGLRTCVDSRSRYVVQCRTFLESAVSDFELRLRRDSELAAAYKAQGVYFSLDHSEYSWRKYALWAVEFWNKFIDKWVLSMRDLNCLVVRYEDILRDPAKVVSDVLVFVGIDFNKPCRLDFGEVKKKRDLTRFDFYDPHFMRELEAMTGDRHEAAGLETVF